MDPLMILPRVIRLRDAPKYLGMDKNRFNAEVRPFIVQVSYGKRGVGFDRLDLDAWFADYKQRNGQPGHRLGTKERGGKCQTLKCPQVSKNGGKSGTSTKRLEKADDFNSALELVMSRKRSGFYTGNSNKSEKLKCMESDPSGNSKKRRQGT